MDTSQLAHPKPEPRAKVKARKDRADAKALTAFRSAVWARESRSGYAWCQVCGYVVRRDREPLGEVHHIISRRHKATRYDPANGQVLCADCHRAVRRVI